MNEQEGSDIVPRFFSGTGTTYDLISNLATIGFDRLWKRKILERIPPGSTRIMDQACGTGILSILIAQGFPHCRVTGVDMTEEYIQIARSKARSLGLSNIELILGKAEDVLLETCFDCVTSSYLAKYAELGVLIQNIGRMLRQGGVLVMHDFTYPPNPVFARIWELYFRVLQTVGTRRYPAWRTIFQDLPGLLRETKWVNQLVGCLRENLFSEISVQSLTLGTSAIVSAKKSAGC